ncbi:substrate-binding domain-containing protein [Cellulomonas fimi]|uniref:Regulatory protein DeoR n=1 Tax=Cellulomonas fimi (strain ATCC 484 / DSM 20113 / JCM 1341 / CCUG 24087 / LMG 16345 / NBRC 15513 / NCIMB 8980 / NCTC 7547 / NRS-133) TaxID=590998 RepID=F4H0M1_CELFA|nr:substrate-binding domain-containing protein [Cellulomonas fimi]AEE44994.1 regulatory protein DeoR [Cellulomonas fimi ATCC 484]NNH08975.1 DeoR/GlpR family transcriptional regulator [Cellulomonas fimi]VEH27914.1 Arabinose metabolism transcriptional repressor [Cellulomonas fimi]
MSEPSEGPVRSTARAPLPSSRRDEILAILRHEGTVRVTDLAARLDVTPVTARRDVTRLAGEGLVHRVHGGVTLDRPDDAAGDVGRAVERSPHTTATGGPTLGVVVPSLDYYWPGVLHGARDAAVRTGARLVLRGSTYDAAEDARQVRWLVEHGGVDGLLVAPHLGDPAAPGPGTGTGPRTGTGTGDATASESAALLALLLGQPAPVVLLERTAPDAAVESVVSDHALGARTAVHHLAGLGHRRVGLLCTPGSPTTPHVRRGWLDACTGLGLPTDGTPAVSGAGPHDPDRRAVIDALLDACAASGTTAVLVHSDPEAMALVDRCQERGLRVPQDLSVVAYDDEVAALAAPALTAVRPPRGAVGRAAVELLVARLRDPGRPRHRVVIEPELVVRESTAPPPS